MDYQTIKSLITETQNKGIARYEAWEMNISDNVLSIYHNGGKIACFYMTAYEEGYLETFGIPSKLESAELDHIEHYLLGLAPKLPF